MERIPGAERYRKYVPPMLIILTIGFMVWATPRSMVVTLDEARAMGGTHHPLLGFLGVMSAKNTVVNLMILTTFLSYILYRRANKLPTKPWVKTGMAVQWAAFGAAAAVVVFYGIYGYFVESIVRIGFSVYQVLAVIGAIVVVMAIDVPMFKGARSTRILVLISLTRSRFAIDTDMGSPDQLRNRTARSPCPCWRSS
jgi:hypothetical protein